MSKVQPLKLKTGPIEAMEAEMRTFIVFGLFIFSMILTGIGQSTASAQDYAFEDPAARFVSQWVKDATSANDAIATGDGSRFAHAWAMSTEEMRNLIAFFPAKGEVIELMNVSEGEQDGTTVVDVMFTGLFGASDVLQRGEFSVVRTDGTDGVGFYMVGFKPLPMPGA